MKFELKVCGDADEVNRFSDHTILTFEIPFLYFRAWDLYSYVEHIF